jgi:hypothetical protein
MSGSFGTSDHVTGQSGIFGMNDAIGAVPDGLNRPAGAGVGGHTKVEKGAIRKGELK